MASTAASYRNPAHAVKFDHDFIERRFREHHQLQEKMASECGAAIVKEVIGAWESYNQVRAGKGPGKIARLK
jgi:hypothetical protein